MREQKIVDLFQALHIINLLDEVNIVEPIEIVEEYCALFLEDHRADAYGYWEVNQLVCWQN